MLNRSWVYVLIGFLISSFLGGAVRVFFSDERIRLLVNEVLERRQPKFHFDFKGARLNLSHKWLPSIAIELTEINIKSKDSCVTNSSLYSKSLVVPLEIKAIFEKKIRFGLIEASGVRFYKRAATCAISKDDSEKSDDLVPLERFFQKRWNKEVINTTRYIKGLKIQDLEIINNDESLSPLKVLNYDMSFSADKGEGLMSFELYFGPPLIGQADVGPHRMNMSIRQDRVELLGSGYLKEGQTQIAGSWDINKSDFFIELKARDIPASEVLRLAQHYGFLTQLNPVIKHEWLNCSFRLEGPVRQLKQQPLRIRDCGFYGEFGQVDILTTKYNYFQNAQLQLEFKSIDVKKVLNSFGLGRNLGIVSKFGHFSGIFLIKEKSIYELSGAIQDFELYFSFFGEQQRQKLSQVDLALHFANGQTMVKLTKFKPLEGELVGEILLNTSENSKNLVQVFLSSVILPTSYSKILAGLNLGRFSLNGKGVIADYRMEQFQGQLVVESVFTSDWIMRAVKLNLQSLGLKFNAHLTSNEFSLFPESRWTPFLTEIEFSGGKKNVEISSFRGLAADIDFSENKNWTWANLVAKSSQSGVKIFSSGNYESKNGLNGQMKSIRGSQLKKWTVKGDFKAPHLIGVEAP